MKPLTFAALATLLSIGVSSCSSATATTSSPSPSPRRQAGDGPGARNGARGSDDIKPYGEVITSEAVSDSGLFIVHRIDEDLFYEIPNEMLEREMLVVSRIARTATNLGYGGQKANTQSVRWTRRGKHVDLRIVAFVNVADSTEPIAAAVENSNFEPIAASFDVAAYRIDSTRIDSATVEIDTVATVIEVTDLYQTDIPVFAGIRPTRRTALGVRRLDTNRSFIREAHSYPRNIEVRSILTYDATKGPSNPSAGSISLEMAHSMILLPDEPMQPRRWDDRVGFFSLTQTDYGVDAQRAVQRRYITRWRLEPTDPAAWARGQLVDPVKPIVYYIDPNTPEKWRPYLKQGIEDWQEAFEAAGFSNAIIARDPPTPDEDPEFSPEDIRYSVIRYFPSAVQNASGPHVHDPRTGEILESDINWYHNVMNLVRNWYFVQTAAANAEARNIEFDDDVMGKLVRFVAAHEVGHTLGLQHAMQSSAAYPVDSLRSASFTCSMGTAPSIMDYARFNYVAQPGDDGVCFMPGIGPYDKWAIEWGYRPIPREGTESERATLNRWVLDHADPIYRYGSSRGYDPTSPSEALSDDPVRASEYGIENLKVIVPNLMAWTTRPGEDYSQLTELYTNVIEQWSRYMRHVTAVIGGVERTSKTADQDGPVYEIVPEARQRLAMQFFDEQVFHTPAWMINEDIIARIEHAGIVERIRQRQVSVINSVLDPGRMQRLIESEARLGDAAYTLGEMMTDLRRSVWTELRTGGPIDTYRRNLQRGYVERMRYLMENEQPEVPARFRAFSQRTNVNVSQSDIRAFVRGELDTLRGQVNTALGRRLNQTTRYHLRDVYARMNDILDIEN